MNSIVDPSTNTQFNQVVLTTGWQEDASLVLGAVIIAATIYGLYLLRKGRGDKAVQLRVTKLGLLLATIIIAYAVVLASLPLWIIVVDVLYLPVPWFTLDWAAKRKARPPSE